MRRVAVAVLIVAVVLAAAAPPAQACGECVALGVVSFLAFAGIVAAATAPPVVYAAPAYYAPAYYAAPWSYPGSYVPVASYPPAYYYAGYYAPRYYYPAAYVAAPPAVWTGPRVVQYAHGRYELRGDGVSVPYVWVWIPNGSPAPPVPANPDGPEGSGAARER